MKTGAVLTLLAALAAAGAASAPRPASATILQAATLDELAREADLVAVVTPTVDRRSYWREGRIFTDVRCVVTAVLKGASGPSVVVRLPGGTVGDIGQSVAGAPALGANVPVVAFLTRPRDGGRAVLSMAAGLLPVSVVGGVVQVLPARTEGITFLPGAPPVAAPRVVVPAGGLALAAFVERVREVTR
jgi:hypothetical protein